MHSPTIHLCVAALLAPFGIIASQGNAESVIVAIGNPKLTKPGGKSARQSVLDVSNFKKDKLMEMDRITAKFMKDTKVLEYVRVPTEGNSWHGEVVEGLGEMNVFYNERTDTLVGSAYTEDVVINFNTEADGSVVATEIANEEFPEDAEPDVVPEEDLPEGESGRKLSSSQEYRLRRIGDARNLSGGENIDIMIVYTKSTMCEEAGFGNVTDCGYTADNRAPIEAKALLAIEETNTMFELSGINTRFRLVHTYGTDYDDSGTYDYGKMLNHLKTKDDGFVDEVHAKREFYGADLVQMWVTTSGYCGMAYMFSGNSKDGFSVDERGCATGYFSFGHETGHNMGCTHDKETKGCGETCEGINYGWRSADEEMRTNMAYSCPKGSSCPKVQRFSNTFAPVNGIDVGSASENNAQVIMNNQEAVANFVTPSTNMPCESDDDCNDTHECNGEETCLDGVCYGGYPVEGECCGNGICEAGAGEDKDNCCEDCCQIYSLNTKSPPGTRYTTNGNMFDLVVQKNIDILGFEMTTYTSGVCNVEIYTHAGSHVDVKRNPGEWTLVQSTTIVAKYWSLHQLPSLSEPVTIPAGSTRAFYVTLTNGCQALTAKGTLLGSVFKEDGNLQYLEGTSILYPFSSSNWSPHIFQGVIWYEVVDHGALDETLTEEGAFDREDKTMFVI